MDSAYHIKTQSLKPCQDKDQIRFLYSEQLQISNYSSLPSYHQLSQFIPSQQSGTTFIYNKQNIKAEQRAKNPINKRSFNSFRNSQSQKNQQMKKYSQHQNLSLKRNSISDKTITKHFQHNRSNEYNSIIFQQQKSQERNQQNEQTEQFSDSLNHYQKSLISSSFIEIPSPDNRLEKRMSKYFGQGCTQCLLM